MQRFLLSLIQRKKFIFFILTAILRLRVPTSYGGEFGRTPKVQWEAPWNGGRGHYGKVFSVVVAGGGFKGGRVVGASDAKGETVKERPVYPVDLISSIYELLGIDTSAKLPHPQGLDVRVTASTADGMKMGGRLKEIM